MDSTYSTGQTRKSRLRHVWVFLNDTTVFKGHTQVMPARLPMATQFAHTYRDSRWRVCTLVGCAQVIFWVQFSTVSMSPTWRVVLRHWIFAHILSLCCLNKFESAWISETVQVKDWSSTSTQRRKSARWLQCSFMIWSAAHWAVVLRCKSKN